MNTCAASGLCCQSLASGSRACGIRRPAARDYRTLLARHGLLREDMPVEEIGYACQAIFEGFLRADGTIVGQGEGQDQRANLLARTVRRAFEREPAITDGEMLALATTTASLLSTVVDADRDSAGASDPVADR